MKRLGPFLGGEPNAIKLVVSTISAYLGGLLVAVLFGDPLILLVLPLWIACYVLVWAFVAALVKKTNGKDEP